MPYVIPNPNLVLAAGRTRADLTLTPPPGFETGEGVLEVSLAALTDLISAGEAIEMTSFKMGPVASEKIDVTPLHSESKVEMHGQDNYEANVVTFRSVGEDGKPDEGDAVYAAVGAKGVVAYWPIRELMKAKIALQIGDTGFIYKTRSDNPVAGEFNGALTANIAMTVLARRPFIITA